jgi:hypothetical protein
LENTTILDPECTSLTLVSLFAHAGDDRLEFQRALGIASGLPDAEFHRDVDRYFGELLDLYLGPRASGDLNIDEAIDPQAIRLVRKLYRDAVSSRVSTAPESAWPSTGPYGTRR